MQYLDGLLAGHGDVESRFQFGPERDSDLSGICTQKLCALTIPGLLLLFGNFFYGRKYRSPCMPKNTAMGLALPAMSNGDDNGTFE